MSVMAMAVGNSLEKQTLIESNATAATSQEETFPDSPVRPLRFTRAQVLRTGAFTQKPTDVPSAHLAGDGHELPVAVTKRPAATNA